MLPTILCTQPISCVHSRWFADTPFPARALLSTVVIMTSIYLTVACTGYAAFGDSVAGALRCAARGVAPPPGLLDSWQQCLQQMDIIRCSLRPALRRCPS